MSFRKNCFAAELVPSVCTNAAAADVAIEVALLMWCAIYSWHVLLTNGGATLDSVAVARRASACQKSRALVV